MTGFATCSDEKALWDNADFVVVGFPNRLGFWGIGENFAAAIDQGDLRSSKFWLLCFCRCTSIVASHELVPGTNAQYRDVEIEISAAIAQLTGQADPCCTSRQNEAVQLSEFGGGCRVCNNLSIDPKITQHAPFSMGPLSSVVDDIDNQWWCTHRSLPRLALNQGDDVTGPPIHCSIVLAYCAQMLLRCPKPLAGRPQVHTIRAHERQTTCFLSV